MLYFLEWTEYPKREIAIRLVKVLPLLSYTLALMRGPPRVLQPVLAHGHFEACLLNLQIVQPPNDH